MGCWPGLYIESGNKVWIKHGGWKVHDIDGYGDHITGMVLVLKLL